MTWDDSDPDRPIAIVDVRCSAGTYVRALARDLGEAVGSAAYLGALVRTASGPFTIDGATPLDDDPGRGRGRARTRLARLLLPVDAGPRGPAGGRPRRGRGRGRSPAASSCGPAAAWRVAGDGPIRVRDEARDARRDRPATATAGSRPTRSSSTPRRRSPPVPDGGPVTIGGVDGLGGTTGRSSRSSACSTASTAATSTCSATSSGRPSARDARPTVITFDAHPDEVLLGAGAAAAAAIPRSGSSGSATAGVEVVVVEHFDAALRATPYDAFLQRITAADARSPGS